jgi:hypothetical protein
VEICFKKKIETKPLRVSGKIKRGRNIVIFPIFNSFINRGSINMKYSMTGQEKGDLLKQVTA